MHRAHTAVLVEAVARLELGRAGNQLLQQRVVGAFLHIQPLHGKARLAAVEKAAHRDGAGGALQVRVVEHDAWIAAAELEGDLLQKLRRASHHLLACRGGTGERDLADQRVRHDGVPRRLADHDVDHALGQPAFDQRFDACERRQRRRARGFQDYGVARGNRGRDLVGRQGQRKVPRHDGAAHADRLAHDQAIGREVGQPDVLAVDLVRQVGEPRDVLAEPLGLDARLEQRLALLPGQDRRDVLDLFQHVTRRLVQDLGPLVGGKLRPRGESLRRSLRRLVDVRGTAGGNLVDDLAGGRVADLVRFTRCGLGPVAFDDHRRHAPPPSVR